MENDSKIIDTVAKDKELAGRMKEAFSKGATPQELADILKDAEVEVEASEVEEVTAQMQAFPEHDVPPSACSFSG